MKTNAKKHLKKRFCYAGAFVSGCLVFGSLIVFGVPFGSTVPSLNDFAPGIAQATKTPEVLAPHNISAKNPFGNLESNIISDKASTSMIFNKLPIKSIFNNLPAGATAIPPANKIEVKGLLPPDVALITHNGKDMAVRVDTSTKAGYISAINDSGVVIDGVYYGMARAPQKTAAPINSEQNRRQ